VALLLTLCLLSGLLAKRSLALPEGQAEELVEELKRLEKDLSLKERRLKLLEERVSKLEAELRAKEAIIEALRANLTRLLASLRGTIDEIELLTLFSLDNTSVARRVNATTSYGHNYTLDLREIRGRTTLSLVLDGELLVGRPTAGGVEPEVIYSKPLPSTLTIPIKGAKQTFYLAIKHLLIWINGTETREWIKVRVRIAAIPKALFEELRKTGWPPLRELFKRAVIIYDEGFKVPPS